MSASYCSETFNFIYPFCYLLCSIGFYKLMCPYGSTQMCLAIGWYLLCWQVQASPLGGFYWHLGNTQSRVQPSLQAATTGVVLIASLPAAVASSANHTCLALGSASLSLSISGLTAKAYIAIANGSPWVVPSLESISPPPTIKSLIGAWYGLLSMVDIVGHITWMLWRAACLFMTLKAFEASTSFRLSAFFLRFLFSRKQVCPWKSRKFAPSENFPL